MTHRRRAIGEIDPSSAATQRTPECLSRIDPAASRIGQEATRGHLIVRQGHLSDQPLGHSNLGGRHLGEILGLQDLTVRDGEAGGEFGLLNRLRLLLPGCSQGLSHAKGTGLRLLLLPGSTRSDRRHLGDELFDQGAPSPEDFEGLVEQDAVLVSLHEDSVKRPVKVLACADPCRLDRRNGIENRPGADRKTGNPQGACEIRDVVCKTAFTQVGCVANQTEALSALWT